MSRLDGTRRLVHQAVRGVVALVEASHAQVSGQVAAAARLAGLGEAAQAVSALDRAVLKASTAGVRGLNALVESLGDALADAHPVPPPLMPLRSDLLVGPQGALDQWVGLLNGLLGDGLAAQANPLDLKLNLRLGDGLLPTAPGALETALRAAPAGTGWVVLVHGLATTEGSWCVGAEDRFGDPASTLGARLQAERGWVPVYVRYNTGRTVAENGAALDQRLARLAAALDRVGRGAEPWTVIGHSMGGLVVREALGRAAPEGWRARVTHAACLGSPHHGAPLAKLADLAHQALAQVPTPGAGVPAALLALRSAGIRDLGPGDQGAPGAAWRGRALPEGPRWLLLSSTLAADPDSAAGRALGDGMVRPASALRDADPCPRVTRVRLGGVGHVALCNHPATDGALRAFLDGR
ncbi:MAG: alpha/beta fold hydrolase [Myxococcales bacterium]|nr:alpha/beta fold hydrolase [Myxococcales bacterium]